MFRQVKKLIRSELNLNFRIILTWSSLLALTGSGEEAWFDPALESDWSDEDFQSIPDGL